MKDLCIKNLQVIIYYDSMSSIYLATNAVVHARTKHIEVHYHFLREKVWPSRTLAYASPQAWFVSPPLLSDSSARPHRSTPVCIYKRIHVECPPSLVNLRTG